MQPSSSRTPLTGNTSNESVSSYQTRWKSIRVLYLSIFFNSLIFSIVLSSIWPFLKRVDPNVSATYLGWVHGGFSVAGCISNLAFGKWMDKRNAHEPLYCSLVLFFIGSLVYAWAEAFGEINGGKEAILVSRIITGISTGNVAILRALVAQSTTLQERTRTIAHFVAFQALGFALGPALQLLGIPIGDRGVNWKSLKLTLNVYTYPGFLGALMAIINIVAVYLYFKPTNLDVYTGADESERKYQEQLKEGHTPEKKPDPIAIGVYMILHFVSFATFSFVETLLTTLAIEQYAWTGQQGILYTGIMFTVSGFLAIAVFVVTEPFTKRIGERFVLMVAFTLMAIGFFVFLPWGDELPKLAVKSSDNSTATKDSLEVVGCPETYEWCKTTPKILLPQFIIAFTIITLGFPMAFAMIPSLYSKTIKPGRQGVMMAWLGTVGSLSRVVGPTATTNAYARSGPRWTFVGVDILQVLAIILIACIYKKLVPYHVYILGKTNKQHQNGKINPAFGDDLEIDLVQNDEVQLSVSNYGSATISRTPNCDTSDVSDPSSRSG